METTVLNIKTNKSLKKSAQDVAKSLDLPLSTIMNSYLRKLVKERRVEFVDHPMPNKETQRLLKEIDVDIKSGKNLNGPFDCVEDAVKFLNS